MYTYDSLLLVRRFMREKFQKLNQELSGPWDTWATQTFGPSPSPSCWTTDPSRPQP